MRTRPIRSAAQTAVDAACLLGVLAVVLWPLVAVYGGTTAVPAIVGGLLLGGGTTVVAAARRWSTLATVAALVVAFVLFGGALAAPSTTVAGVVPTVDTLETLARGVGSSWQQMLTLQPPVGSSGGLLVAPYLLALLGAATALGIALRARRGGASAIAVPVAVAGVVAVLGTRQPSVPPVTTGLVLLLVLLPWAAWRAGTLRPRRVVSLLVIGAVAAGAAVLGAPAVVGDTPRLVVRDEIVPPFDPRAYPSPLAAFRDYVKREKDTTLFTVSGLPPGASIRLATMDRYDGVVWNVAGNGTAQSSGEFRRVGDTIPTSVRGSSAHVEVDIDALSGVWLPTVGAATSFDIADSGAADGLRFNEATGAAVLTGALRPGLSYSMDVVVPRDPTDAQVGRAAAQDVSQPPTTGVPDVVAVTAADVARDAGTPVQVARTLQQWLAQEGYFSHGATDSNQVQSLSGHGANRMVALLDGDLMVGDGEQYAAAMALMAREMGLPSRVVLGFAPQAPADASADEDEPVKVTGDDLEAWVEIPFAGYGWVPFYPTPPREQTPEQNEKPNPSEPQPQVVQPPPPAPDAVKPPDDDTEQPGATTPPSDDSATSVWVTVALVAGAVAVPLFVLALPFLVIGAIKAGRRRKRRRERDAARRVVGGWDELLDAAVDLRQPVLAHATRAESARSLSDGLGAAGGVHKLASAADRAVFSARRPTASEAAAYWADVDSAVREMRRGVGWRRRTRARLSLVSLRGRHRPGRRRS